MRVLATMAAIAVSLMATTADLAASPPVDADARDAVTLGDSKTAVKTEVLVLHGTNDGKGLDPKIGKLPQLQEPPFSAYNSYKLLKREDLDLEQGKASNVQLPNESKLGLKLEGVEEAKKGKRYKLEASIEGAKGKAFLPGVKWSAAKGEFFFLAGQKHKEGILVLGIRIAP
jgi:hypothetical protein